MRRQLRGAGECAVSRGRCAASGLGLQRPSHPARRLDRPSPVDARPGAPAGRADAGPRRPRRRADRGLARAGARRFAAASTGRSSRATTRSTARSTASTVIRSTGSPTCSRQLSERQPMTAAVALCHLPGATPRRAVGAAREQEPRAGDAAAAGGARSSAPCARGSSPGRSPPGSQRAAKIAATRPLS